MPTLNPDPIAHAHAHAPGGAARDAEPMNAWVKALLMVLVGVGLFARLAPLFDGTDRQYAQFPTEDGYLTLTIARDMADGLGMTTAEGTIPTNGTQPLCTLMWAAVFWLHGGQGMGAFRSIQLIQILFASLSAWLLYRLGRLVIGASLGARRTAAVAAALWFAAPHTIAKTQNCLETGAYTLVAVLFALLLVRQERSQEQGDRMRIGVAAGLLLGLAFWVRNDAVFLSAGFCGTWLLLDRHGRPGLPFTQPGSGQALVAGIVALLISLPWLFYNVTRFGSIVPISGQAQTAGNLGTKVTAMPSTLLELATIILPGSYSLELLPHRVEQVSVALLLALYAWGLYRLRHQIRLGRRPIAVLTIFMGGLVGYYCMTSFANWHFGRYLFPTSPFFALASVALLFSQLDRLRAKAAQVAVIAFLATTVAIVGYRNLEVYQRATSTTLTHHGFARWVERNGLTDEWVGAPESGVLGFYYPRTVNLDGKVNPDAMRARREGRYADYLLGSEIAYIVGQVGFVETELAHDPRIAEAFEWIERDEQLNVAVVRRRSESPIAR
ncbi:MAG: hypothetical protein ACI8QZ_000562 [Chlamydiales bacterium]|jgi:hypothetical protein